MELTKDTMQLIGLIVSIVIPVTSIMLWFIRREFNRIDELPKAINQLSKAIAKLVRWKVEFVAQSKAHRRHTNSRLCGLEEQQDLLVKRIEEIEDKFNEQK